MNKKLTPFDAIAELDSISISVEQISNTFNIVLEVLENECPAIGCSDKIDPTAALYFTTRFPKFYYALDLLGNNLIDLVSRINETVDRLTVQLREEKEEEKKPRDLAAEILANFALLTVEDKKKAVALAQQPNGIGKEYAA